MGTDVNALVTQKYPRIAKDLVRPFIELLCISREACGGDLEQALILYAIGARTLEHEAFKCLDMHDVEHGLVEDLPSLRTNARSIAESLRLPRESTRRKVRALIDAGLVVRTGYDLMLSRKALVALTPVRNLLIGTSIKYYEVVREVIHAEAGTLRPLIPK